MSELTKIEDAWLKKVQKLINECPSSRLGFYTIGDRQIKIYDKRKDAEIDVLMTGRHNMDWCQAVDRLDIHLGRINFPSNVHSTAG